MVAIGGGGGGGPPTSWPLKADIGTWRRCGDATENSSCGSIENQAQKENTFSTVNGNDVSSK